PDLFYSDYKGSSLHYHLNSSGAGNIAFGPALELYTGIAPKGIGAADFDDDGKVDFAIVHFGNDRLTTLMNTTEGASLAFELRKSFKTSLMPEQLLLSDFDQDGLTDIAVIGAEEALLTVFKNRCTADTVLFHGGNFRLEGLPVAMGHGDFNQDGKPDLAVVSGEGKLLQLFENKGQPGNNMFVNVHSYLLNEQASGVSMADVNFDGYTDLMVSYEDASGVAVFQQLLGQEGDFSAPREISVSQAPYAALPLQWENKTTTDLLVANQSASALGILKNTTPETVLTQPEDAKVNSGSNAYFHIETSTGLWTYQWQAKEGEHFYDLTDDQRYQNATTPELTVLEADADMDETVYRCLVLMDGCVYKISEQARLNVASALADAADAWMVYPNPSLDNAYLVIPADVLTESVLRVELLDQEGKQVFLESWNLSEEGNHKALPISGFAKGNYFLKVYNEDGKLLYSEKVVAL
ncbi:MAG: FG-GAP-like repeat-containing protein, partial [Salibacteraceae bacterium]